MNYTGALRQAQDRFARHVSYLISYIKSETDLTISLGRAFDTPEAQEVYVRKGLSQSLNSMHLLRLAIDLNFFEGEYYLFSDKSRSEQDMKLIEPIGEYWESLHPDNRWGGFWKSFPDAAHFENNFKYVADNNQPA